MEWEALFTTEIELKTDNLLIEVIKKVIIVTLSNINSKRKKKRIISHSASVSRGRTIFNGILRNVFFCSQTLHKFFKIRNLHFILL